MRKNDPIKSITNAIEIMDFVNENEINGISAISKNLNIPKTTVFRILKTLESVNFISKVSEDNYSIGYKIKNYQVGIKRDKFLISKSKAIINDFVEKTGETVNLAVKNDNDKSFIIYSKQGDFYTLQSNMSPESELYCSSTGKIFLSTFEEEKLKLYFEKNLEKRTVNTITDYKTFCDEKKEILKYSIAYDKEEYEYGLTCIASTIRMNNEIVAAISISGPTTRLKFKGFEFLESELIKAAKLITEKISSN